MEAQNIHPLRDALLLYRSEGHTHREIALHFSITEKIAGKIMGRTGRIREGKARPLSVRFWEKVSVKNVEECWLWHGAKGKNGYGHIKDQVITEAHRISWKLHNGEIPEGAVVRHTCDTKLCVNPGHLLIGTYKDNTHDMDVRGRRHPKALRGADHPRAKLTWEQAEEIKQRHKSGESQNKLAQFYDVSRPVIRNIVKFQGYAATHEEILQGRKEGAPSVAIRKQP